jgi:dihydropteroate synthase
LLPKDILEIMVLEKNLKAFKIMGVVNITPDSFSDGGLYLSPQKALEKAVGMIKLGADLIDIGAESTRPGALPLSAEQEWVRLEPVLNLIKEHNISRFITVDTMKPEIMERLVDWKIAGINDVSGCAPDDLLCQLRRSGKTHHVTMHMHQNPQTMQKDPMTGIKAVEIVSEFFVTQNSRLLKCGFESGQFWLDPGIGFGKTDQANLFLMSQVSTWRDQFNIAIGISRKSFIGRLLDIDIPSERDLPSKTLELGLLLAGAGLIRTHEIRPLIKIRNILMSG